eukprot:5219995-Alexandrium_andersonii.AAC.1
MPVNVCFRPLGALHWPMQYHNQNIATRREAQRKRRDTRTRTHNTTTLASSATSHSGTWLEKAGMQQHMVRTFADAGAGRAGRCGVQASTHPLAN